jgi:hypothetical protein
MMNKPEEINEARNRPGFGAFNGKDGEAGINANRHPWTDIGFATQEERVK